MWRLYGFMAELEKIAVEGDARRLYKRFGKNKEFVLINNLKDRNQKRLARIAGRQPRGRIEARLKALLNSTTLGREQDQITKKILKEPGNIIGTLAKGKKGFHYYIARDKIGKGKSPLRELVNHEGFHGKIPILGKSEILAHFYGGLKSEKGKNNITKGFKQVFHGAKMHPFRIAAELAVLGGSAYAGKKIYDKIKEGAHERS